MEGIQFTPVTGDLRDKKSVQEAMKEVDPIEEALRDAVAWFKKEQSR